VDNSDPSIIADRLELTQYASQSWPAYEDQFPLGHEKKRQSLAIQDVQELCGKFPVGVLSSIQFSTKRQVHDGLS
jgi:hypothetical protein